MENEWHRKTFQSFRNYDNSQNINFVGMQIDKLMSESELIIYEEQSLARRKKFLKGWFQVSNFFE